MMTLDGDGDGTVMMPDCHGQAPNRPVRCGVIHLYIHRKKIQSEDDDGAAAAAAATLYIIYEYGGGVGGGCGVAFLALRFRLMVFSDSD